MNIFFVLFVLSFIEEEAPVLPSKPRADRRAARASAIAHNRRVYHDIIGSGIWFEKPKADGIYRRYASGQYHHNAQQGRWETNYLKTRSITDTGRIHAGDKKRKGKRSYCKQELDELRYKEALKDYLG